jgi:hypothetical protein
MENCAHCGRPFRPNKSGRPRQYCCIQCNWAAAKRKERGYKRQEHYDALIAALANEVVSNKTNQTNEETN